jgi:succinate dehydrogenase / fumarate reductase, cytochrome b subunit
MTEIYRDKYFFWRRMHSFTGGFLALFLIIHLLTNSQAVFFLGEDGKGFIHSVNAIKNLPYLPLIEIFLLATPILIHIFWGVQYLFTSQFNSFKTNGSKPYVNYPRNRAYTWQRMTSWILLFTLLGHIAHMRFYEEPQSIEVGDQREFVVHVTRDTGLNSLAERLALKEEPLDQDHVKIIAKDFGTAELIVLREAFKSPVIMAIYTIFVLAACFHAFNGLFTFMITWGITLKSKTQDRSRKVCMALMAMVAFLGLSTIFGTYWVNLRW